MIKKYIQLQNMNPTASKSGFTPTGIILAALLTIFFFIADSGIANAQNEGKQLFEKNCQVCHKIGGGKLVGPELLGVTERRERDWIAKFIRNSKAMIDAGRRQFNNALRQREGLVATHLKPHAVVEGRDLVLHCLDDFWMAMAETRSPQSENMS